MTPVLLLDLDKTLVNVEDFTDYCSALRELEARGFAAMSTGPETYWGKCTKKVMDILISLSGDEWIEANKMVERYEIEGAERAVQMPYLQYFLANTINMPKAIVTLLGVAATKRVLERFNIAVNAVVAREPGIKPKPHPDPVIKALSLLGASPGEAVMIGDSEWDELSAQAAGVRFIAVTNGREKHFFRTPFITRDLKEAVDLLKKL